MKSALDVIDFVAREPEMVRLLRAVEAQRLPDCWIGAGFLRNAIWDALHGWPRSTLSGDIDVVFFDASDIRPERELEIEAALTRACSHAPWSAKNQARMHIRNGDAAYRDTLDALRHWPERCTAVAVRSSGGRIELLAPFGVSDLLALVVRPTPAFVAKMSVYLERVRRKNWHRRWPGLRIVTEPLEAAGG